MYLELKPEEKLVLYCASNILDVNTKKIIHLVNDDLDWSYILKWLLKIK